MTEVAVRRAWKAVFGHDPASPAETMEAAGVDSLGVFQFVLYLETLLGRPLPMERFTGGPSFAECIAIAARRQPPPEPQDPRPTVFLFPGLNGDEPRLARLRAELEDRIRFVLIEYPPWPEMACRGEYGFDLFVEKAVRQITAQAAPGAIDLAGYSFGAHVAFPTAVALQRRGWTIRFFGVLDGGRPPEMQRLPMMQHLARRARQIAEDLRRGRMVNTAGIAWAKFALDVTGLPAAARLRRRWSWAPAWKVALVADRRIETILRWKATVEWLRRPSSDRLNAAAVLFRSDQTTLDAAVDYGWSGRCTSLRIIRVGGTHHSFLDEPALRTELASALAELEPAPAAPERSFA